MVAGREAEHARHEVRIIRENSIHARPEQLIGPLNKGLGKMDSPAAGGDIVRLGWNLLREDLSLPSAVLYRDRLEHNLAWMQRFMDAYKVKLAPHGKTTMAPRLFEMQLKSGAWGITLASAHQTVVAHTHGVKRVLMANQLVGKQNIQMIADLLTDSEFEFYCLVDSAAGVNLLGEFFSERGLRLNVLLELGVMGGRCGVRDDVQLEQVLDALTQWRTTIQLCGVELYEGVLKEESEIRALMRRACKVTQTLLGVQVVIADVELCPRLAGNDIARGVADIDRGEFEIGGLELRAAEIERLLGNRHD